jgi:hypothetical protein
VPDLDGTIYEPGETFTGAEYCFNLSVSHQNSRGSMQTYHVTVRKTC